jgi:hypothetical protein
MSQDVTQARRELIALLELMRRRSLIAIAALSLTGCATTSQQQAEMPLFGRVDCQTITGNIELEREFELAKQICLPRAEAAAVAGGNSSSRNEIVWAIDTAITRNQIGRATINSCMAEQGYLLHTRTEHDAICASLKARHQASRKRS